VYYIQWEYGRWEETEQGNSRQHYRITAYNDREHHFVTSFSYVRDRTIIRQHTIYGLTLYYRVRAGPSWDTEMIVTKELKWVWETNINRRTMLGLIAHVQDSKTRTRLYCLEIWSNDTVLKGQQKPSSSLRTRCLLTSFPSISQEVSSLEIVGSKNSKLVGNLSKSGRWLSTQ